MKWFLAVAMLFLTLSCATTQEAPPSWSAVIEKRSETDFVLTVVGDAKVKDDQIPVLVARTPPAGNPKVLLLELRYMLPPDRRMTRNPVMPVKYEQKVGAVTSVEEVIVHSDDHPPQRVPVTTM